MRFAPLLFCTIAAALAAPAPTQPYATPRFPLSSAERQAKIAGVRAEIDEHFRTFARERHIPGAVWGVVLDGELLHTGAAGFANLERKIPAGPDTRFRIASMTKSFTALAAFKLRDAGKLVLTDPVAKYFPEFASLAPLTSDAPPVTVRHLLTMTGGFPQDDPWGDRQLADSVEELRAFVAGGITQSNVTGVGFEYSNLGYAVLGQIVSRAAGEPYQRYITRELLEPLGMKDTRWEFADVPAAQLALGYRWEDNTWKLEPMLHDGTYGAMGGLITTLNDFARYVSFHLSAWPPRDEPDRGPVRRATLHEMHKPVEVTAVVGNATNLAGQPAPFAVAYGYGFRWTMDHRGTVSVGHSGGLPGFGSNYRFYPEHGVAVISFSNLTYGPMATANNQPAALLIEKAALPRRTTPASPLLQQRRTELADLLQTWEPALADRILAENFFLDRSREAWIRHAQTTLAPLGKFTAIGELVAENQLRGTFSLVGEKGTARVFFTLTPEKNPKVQELRLAKD